MRVQLGLEATFSDRLHGNDALGEDLKRGAWASGAGISFGEKAKRSRPCNPLRLLGGQGSADLRDALLHAAFAGERPTANENPVCHLEWEVG
jgi:hypothetical protein